MQPQPKAHDVQQRGPVAVFRIDRARRANALSRSVLLGLGAFAREMAGRDDVRALLVTGTGDRHFCAGADLSERQGWDEHEIRQQLALYRSELGALDHCPKVVVAAINGVALGGGLEIAMACDFRLAASHATFGQPETALAIIPGAGGTQRLPRLIGAARAKELILLGKRLDAREALAWGLVHRVVDEGADVVEEAIAWLAPVVEGAPIAQAAALEAIDASDLPLDQGLAVEARAYERVLASEDRREGVQAFLDKRPPRYLGR